MTLTLAVFLMVYAGMLLGRLPGLTLDRTGVALLGAIVLLAAGIVDMDAAVAAVDLPTLLLLFSFMVLSAQLRLGGFFDWITRRVAGRALTPQALLAALVAVIGVLAAVFSNDVVCLAVAPVLIDVCTRRRLNPVPFLLALACAANIGSGLTLIGNPQNMLIGQALSLDFGAYLAQAAVPVLLGLGTVWGCVSWLYRGRWRLDGAATASPEAEPLPMDLWQSVKGLAVAIALLLAFLLSPWPHELIALAGAGVLLLSRRMHSRRTLGLVDWQLLVLFVGLFVVNHALQQTPLPQGAVDALAARGVELAQPGWLFAASVVLANLVSNVPSVMLLLPFAEGALAGLVLALSSTFAGNLLIVGSVANIIVVDAAARQGVSIDWRTHARVGVAVTVLTLVQAALWIWWLA